MCPVCSGLLMWQLMDTGLKSCNMFICCRDHRKDKYTCGMFGLLLVPLALLWRCSAA